MIKCQKWWNDISLGVVPNITRNISHHVTEFPHNASEFPIIQRNVKYVYYVSIWTEAMNFGHNLVLIKMGSLKLKRD